MTNSRDTRPPASPARADLHGGKVREAAERLGVRPEEILDFSANVNFLGPIPPVMAAARRSLDQASWYPEETPLSLRRAAAVFLGVEEERVLLGNGASELIFLAVADLRPRRVLVLGPTFTEYERAARAWGAEVDVFFLDADSRFRLDGDVLESEEFQRRMSEADMFFCCDPNNPTGLLLEPAVKEGLVDLAVQNGVTAFIDESFMAFTDAWPDGSSVRYADRDAERAEHVQVLHSFTKLLAIPGLRVGALVASERRAGGLSRRLPPWNINCVAGPAAEAGLAADGLVSRTVSATADARAELAQGLLALEGVFDVLPGAANFLCLELATADAAAVSERTAGRGVLVRDLSRFPGMGPRFLRVAVRSRNENERLLRVLAEALEEAGVGRTVREGSVR